MKNLILPIVLVLAVVGGLYFLQMSDSDDSKMETDSMKKTESIMEDDSMESDSMDKDDEVMLEDEDKMDPLMEVSGLYVDYSEKAVQVATENNKKAVLFFHAPWCPTCRAAEKEIMSRLDEIPGDLTIIKTDYDTNTELKKKYGITIQHTFVQVDSRGELINKWVGGTLDTIIENVE